MLQQLRTLNWHQVELIIICLFLSIASDMCIIDFSVIFNWHVTTQPNIALSCLVGGWDG